MYGLRSVQTKTHQSPFSSSTRKSVEAPRPGQILSEASLNSKPLISTHEDARLFSTEDIDEHVH